MTIGGNNYWMEYVLDGIAFEGRLSEVETFADENFRGWKPSRMETFADETIAAELSWMEIVVDNNIRG